MCGLADMRTLMLREVNSDRIEHVSATCSGFCDRNEYRASLCVEHMHVCVHFRGIGATDHPDVSAVDKCCAVVGARGEGGSDGCELLPCLRIAIENPDVVVASSRRSTAYNEQSGAY